jgi:hypothetical protein
LLPQSISQEAEHSSGTIVDKLSNSTLLLSGSVNDAALTKLLRLGYIRDVILQQWQGEHSAHTMYVPRALRQPSVFFSACATSNQVCQCSVQLACEGRATAQCSHDMQVMHA